MYGKELIIDLHKCNISNFTREGMREYFFKLCEIIKMHGEDIHFWDYYGQVDEYNKAPDHLKGTSAIQFIRTSNITIHTLDVLKKVFINIFSCKDFDEHKAIDFSRTFFDSGVIYTKTIKRR